MKKKFVILIVVLQIFMLVGQVVTADNSLKQWKYYKDILMDGDNKYKSVFMDEEAYKFVLPDLSDVRVVDAKGIFMPYYIVNSLPMEETQVDIIYQTEAVYRFTKDNNTYIDFGVVPINGISDILGSKLSFDVSEDSFLKKVGIYGSFDNVEWEYITEDTIYKVDNLIKNEVVFDEVKKYRYYRIKIPNNLEKIKMAGMQVMYISSNEINEDFTKKSSLNYELKTENKSTFLSLNNSNKLRIKSIHLDVDGNFNRNYSIYTKIDDVYTFEGKSGQVFSVKFKDLDVTNTDIDYTGNPLTAEDIQIKIDNKDDKPLDIKKLEVEYYVDKVVFEDTGNKPYKLYFGNLDALVPSYDVELYKDEIEKEKQDVCTLGAVVNIYNEPTETKPPNYKPIFNIVVIGVAVLLMLFIVLKLRRKRR